MRRSRVLIILSFMLVAAFSLLGTGFSFWAFNEQLKDDVSVGVRVATAETSGNWTEVMLPAVVVMDEGIGSGVNNTITGISFYKKGISPYTGREETLLDDALTIVFETHSEAETETANESLEFGLRISAQGKLASYVRVTSYYNGLKRLENAPGDDYLDLKALAEMKNFDGTDSFRMEKNADGKWEYRFLLTTTVLNMCFKYINGKTPSTQALYDALREDIKNDEKSCFLIELWQGGGPAL